MDTQLKALPALLSSLGAFCLFELRVFQTFLDNLRPICSGLGEPTRRATSTPDPDDPPKSRPTPHASGGSRRCKIRQVVVIRGLRWERLALLLGPGRSGPRHGF